MGARTPLIAGNWKMYKTTSEAVETADALKKRTADATGVEVMIAPPFTAIPAVLDVLKESHIRVGAQNVHWEVEGAYTGEVSAEMLAAAGCQYVIVGHSERRQFFAETDEAVNRKLAAVLRAKLRPVMCIGETETQRESQQTFSVLDKQVENGLKGLFADSLKDLVIAYEPVWAIGTGKTASSAQAQEVHGYLRSKLSELFDAAFAGSIRILYGGSVKPDNISELMAMTDIDGALVGGASLEAESFARIVHYNK